MVTCPSCGSAAPEGFNFCGKCGTRLQATAIREERKVITALFCDLVGSTAIGERLDAEDLSVLLRAYQTICRKRIESHGGVIEKFIGDAVVGVFGIPVAHEDDPERAVAAALRILEDIEASGLAVEVRIGVNTGEALVRLDVDPLSGEGFATGDTLNTAARLEAAAPVMGVAVGAATRLASSASIAYERLAPVLAKGKAEPVAAWRAIQPIARVRAADRHRTAFVGRDLELGMLTQLFERAKERSTTEFVTIVAEPGLGKSRLVRELASYVDELPEVVTWREGRCLPYGDGVTFWALGEIVKSQAGILETDDQRTVLSKLETTLTEPDGPTRDWMKDRLAPLVGLETSTEPPQREEAFTAWRRFIEELARPGPVVIVVEDLHWADAAFVAFLEHIAERTAGVPLLVVVTARPEIEESHPSWPPGRRSTVLSLSPLTDGELESLIVQGLPEATPAITRVVLERAGGSPLYAEQLTAMHRDRSLASPDGFLDETLIPSSVQALIAARLDTLSPGPKQLLMAASVVGKTFWAGSIASLWDHPDLEVTLDDLVRREFCRPVRPSTMEGDAEFCFWHALVREVAYAQLPKSERARMHAAMATWVAERSRKAMGDDAEIVVHHLDAALEFAPFAPELDSAGLVERLSEALIVAGETAFRTDAVAADRLLERGLNVLDKSHPLYFSALGLRGRSLSIAGRPAAALPLLEEAFAGLRARRADEAAAEISGRLASAYREAGRPAGPTSAPGDFLAELGPEPSFAKAVVIGQLARRAHVEAREDEAEVLCGTGLAICHELGLQPPAQLLSTAGLGRILRGDLAGEEAVRRAVEQFKDLGDPDRAANTLWDLGAALGEWVGAAASPVAEEAIQLCLTRGVGSVESFRIYTLLDQIQTGRWEEVATARAQADRAREAGRVGDESIALLAAGYLDMERIGALSTASRLLELAERWDPNFWVASLGGAVLARSDRPEVRIVGLATLAQIADSGSGATWRWLYEEARAAIGAGRPDLAARLVRDPQDFDRPTSRADAEAAFAAVAEAEGRWDDATAGYTAAARGLGALGYHGTLIGPLIGLARCHIRVGSAVQARDALTRAQEICLSLRASVRIKEIDHLVASIP